MPKKREPRTEWVITKGQRSRWQREQRWRRIITISLSSFIALVLVLVGIEFYINANDDDGNPTVLKVNEKSFDMDYYVKMLRLYGIGEAEDMNKRAADVLQAVESREIIGQLAPTLNLMVIEDEVDAKIEEMFPPPENGDNDPDYISYEAFLRQLNRRGLSEGDFREAIASDLLFEKVQEHIGERDVPEEMPQVHLQGILVTSDEALAKFEAKLQDGESFPALAAELSQDVSSKYRGGDLGWLPSDIIDLFYNEEVKKAAFELELDTLSDPIPMSASVDNPVYWMVKALEREDSRQLEESHKDTLQYKAYDDWYTEQRDTFTIEDLLNPDLRRQAITEALG